MAYNPRRPPTLGSRMRQAPTARVQQARPVGGPPPTFGSRINAAQRPVQGSPLGAPAPGVGAAVQAQLGHQLSRRVAAGEISQEQAERTAHQRSLLRQAYGKGWREHVFGDLGRIRQIRQTLSPDNQQVHDLYERLLHQRAKYLQRAAGVVGEAEVL